MIDKDKLEARRYCRSIQKKAQRKRKAGPSAAEIMKSLELSKKYNLGVPPPATADEPAEHTPPAPDTEPFGPFRGRHAKDGKYEIEDAEGDWICTAADGWWAGQVLAFLNGNR